MTNNYTKPNAAKSLEDASTIAHVPGEQKWTLKDRHKPYDEIVRPSGQVDGK